MKLRYPRLALCSLALIAGLPGCAPSEASADSAASAKGRSYELVTVERPESVEEYHGMYKATYEMCAGVRKLQKKSPAPPMLQPPSDYIIQRTTQTHDGKEAYLFHQEYFVYKVEMEEPEFTCRTYLEKTSDTQLARDGKRHYSSVDANGKRESSPPDEWDLPQVADTQIYPITKVRNGHAVKCMEMLPNMEKMITELCVVDLKPGTLTDSVGEPLVAASRVTIVDGLQSVIVTEPVSLRVGHKIDKALFDAAAAP